MKIWRSILSSRWTLRTLLRRHLHPLQRARAKQTDYAIVLDMVQNIRDKLSALNLDNENIRATCDALRRQCQDQGVAFGDLSKLVKQSLEGRQSQQPREETGRPHPLIQPDLIDNRGNLRATDIGITWQGGTFLHGVRVAGPEEDIEDTRPRPATSTPYAPVREHPHVKCQHHDLHVRCVWRFLRRQHTEPARREVRVTGRRHQYSGSTINPLVGWLGSVISKLLLTYTDGTRTNEHYKSSHTSTRKR